jgi:hypothetical protein
VFCDADNALYRFVSLNNAWLFSTVWNC